MTMSDPLAEALYEDICRRATVPMNVWKDAPEYQRRSLESFAAAARAFIGDEIAAEHERLHSSTENVSETRQLRDAQWWHNGMVKAESIARGDTK